MCYVCVYIYIYNTHICVGAGLRHPAAVARAVVVYHVAS